MYFYHRLLHKHPTALINFLHGLEKLLPPPLLFWLLYPFAVYQAWRTPLPFARALPFGPQMPPGNATSPRYSTSIHLIRALELMPDILSSPRWKKRCRIIGLERLIEAHRKGPVILACLHMGPLSLTGLWLRAHGIPVTAMRTAMKEGRSRARLYANSLMPFPEVPSVTYHNHLRDLMRFLTNRGVVMMAIDSPNGRQINVPIDDNWMFRVATGPVRLAASVGAELIPCTILSEGGWRCRIELGPPILVPRLRGEVDLMTASKHLVAELLPFCLSHTDQCLEHVCSHIFPAVSADPSSAPVPVSL